MSQHLLAISVGPVQEFIAAARRTRDLWFGSHLLSEISKAVARDVAGNLAEADGWRRLIFPAPGRESDLHDWDPDVDDAWGVANLILAEVPEGVGPSEVARKAESAASGRWLRFADDALGRLGRRSGVVDLALWESQVGDVIEIYAAWVPFDPGDYPAGRRRLMRLLAGRKNARDFRPAEGRAGVPKSSLDGARESVLVREPGRSGWPTLLRARAGEQLDAVGVTKRVALGHRPYPSASRIAADPWIRGVGRSPRGREGLEELSRTCEALPVHRTRHVHYSAFPHEGTVVYRGRHHELWEEVGGASGGAGPRLVPEAFVGLGDALSRLERLAGAPDPYLAVLVADGDRMGRAISRLASPDENREFSRALARFAGEARGIVEENRGVLVYAGGDDVLAFVPVDLCLACARALRDRFGAILGGMTLSVGVAIGHFLEDMETLLDYGRAAERAAKEPDRDGLAVHLRKRGGAPIEVRRPWGDRPDDRLGEWAGLLKEGAVPSRVAYDLVRLASTYEHWPLEEVAEAIRADAVRVIRRKRPPGAEGRMGRVEALIRAEVRDPSSLHDLARELLIARQLAVALRQAEGPDRPASGGDRA